MSDSPGKRLAMFRKHKRLSQRVFANSLGVSGGLIGQIEADLNPPSRSFLQKISERYLISSDWLLSGVGEMFLADVPNLPGRKGSVSVADASQPAYGDFRFGDEEFAMIRRMDLSVSAGRGLIPVEGGDAEALAFSRSWLLRQRINADLAVLVRVAGDSMAPAIPDQAVVLVHLPEADLDREGVFAFNRGEQSFVKRLIPSGRDKNDLPTSVMIISDNPAYRPEVLQGSELNDLRIVGRVRCVLSTL